VTYVSPGYLIPIKELRGEEPDDADEHAAIERIRCYRAFSVATSAP
jgi:hypothetical protein